LNSRAAQGGAVTNKVKAMKTFLFFRKIDSLILAAAFSLAADNSVKSDWCDGVGFSRPDVVVVENETYDNHEGKSLFTDFYSARGVVDLPTDVGGVSPC
jgi:hypothetical protein